MAIARHGEPVISLREMVCLVRLWDGFNMRIVLERRFWRVLGTCPATRSVCRRAARSSPVGGSDRGSAKNVEASGIYEERQSDVYCDLARLEV